MGTSLSRSQKLGYGIADMGANMILITVSLYLLYFLTDVAGLAPALAGLAVLLGKVYDAVTDPLMGYLSDRTRSRIGRRRPYLLAGALPLGAAYAAVFLTPAGSEAWRFWYAGGAFLLLNTAFTVYNVPYAALAADLTQDYDERTSLTSYRMFFSLVGTLLAGALAMVLVGSRPSPAEGFAWMAGVFGAAIALLSLLTALVTRERVREEPNTLPLLRGIREALGCAPFRRVAGAFFLTQMGLAVTSATLMYYLAHAVRLGDASPAVMALLMVSAILALPLWVKVSGRIGKARSWALGSLLQAPLLAALAVLPPGQPWLVYALTVAVGLSMATQYVFPWAMVPDVVEYDQMTTGERRAGTFSGLWLFTQKIAMAVGIWLTGALLGLFHYQAGAVQADGAVLGIRLTIGLVPALLLLAAAAVLWNYPINRASHEAIRRQAS